MKTTMEQAVEKYLKTLILSQSGILALQWQVHGYASYDTAFEWTMREVAEHEATVDEVLALVG